MRYLAVAMILALCATRASGAEAATRPWLAVTGALSKYAMGDINGNISNVNDAAAGTGRSMDEINGGFAPGASLGLTLSSGLSLGLGYEHLAASSDISVASGSLGYKFSADAFKFVGEFAPAGPYASGLRLGAAVGILHESGSVDVSVSGIGTDSGALTGSGGLFEAFLGGEWWASSQFALTASTGYRYAKVEEPTDDSIFQFPNLNGQTIDYSGVFLRAGLKFSLAH